MKKIINPWIGTEGYNCFGCAPNNEWGVKMEFYEDGDDIVSYWQPDGRFQGWHNTLHGGIQATLLDEICGWVIKRITLRAHITEQRRNIVTVEASLFNEAGEECTHAVCTYFAFPPEKAHQEMHFEHCKTEDE